MTSIISMSVVELSNTLAAVLAYNNVEAGEVGFYDAAGVRLNVDRIDVACITKELAVRTVPEGQKGIIESELESLARALGPTPKA